MPILLSAPIFVEGYFAVILSFAPLLLSTPIRCLSQCSGLTTKVKNPRNVVLSAATPYSLRGVQRRRLYRLTRELFRFRTRKESTKGTIRLKSTTKHGKRHSRLGNHYN
jgi:hypothetical protein